MFDSPFAFIIVIAVLVVLVILMIGIGSFAKGGDFNRRNANRLMRYRIIAQAVAVLLIIIFAWANSGGGN